MIWRRLLVWSSLGLTIGFLGAEYALAQGQGGQGGQGGVGSGVIVDANGVLRTKTFPDPTGMLTRQRLANARASLAPEVARPSKLRKVSLNRLESVLAVRLAAGQGLTDDMRYLVGLTGIRNVFVYPDTGDIVLAGPAEGYAANVAGRMIGINTGRAVLELQDLVVALRAFPPDAKRSPVLLCSIDPSKEGLAKMQQFLISIQGRVSPADAGRIAAGLKENLGLQSVRIEGISNKTHFAQVMVEADYRMKLIGIGLEDPVVKIPSYVSRANPRSVARNALQRWFFTPDYDCVRVSQDRLAMQLEGEGVKLINEDQLVQAGGTRVVSGAVDRASQEFVRTFTLKYPELASKEPVYAQLRNLIDLAIAAAYIQQNDFYGRANWTMEVFGNEQRFPVETYPEPKQVETAVNAVWKGNTLMTPIGGGVSIQPRIALSEEHLKVDASEELNEALDKAQLQNLAKGQWWWD
jgi:hypothetical protein